MMSSRPYVCSAVVIAALCLTTGAAADDGDRRGRADPALVAARQKIFGVENVTRASRR